MNESIYKGEPIRALHMKNPYCALMYHGKQETRLWPTHYRGYVLLCCSKAAYSIDTVIDISGEIQIQRIIKTLSFTPDLVSKSMNGKAMLLGKLVDCLPMEKEHEDICFVKYTPDILRYRHIYEDVYMIEPFELKGAQKWQKLSDEIISKIKLI